ncbi:Hypothetical protein KVN_LOCUS317 [uncultured virus]|nr:Hypothetical protein KVN_LOCUS317 [uncultured virus]
MDSPSNIDFKFNKFLLFLDKRNIYEPILGTAFGFCIGEIISEFYNYANFILYNKNILKKKKNEEDIKNCFIEFNIKGKKFKINKFIISLLKMLMITIVLFLAFSTFKKVVKKLK